MNMCTFFVFAFVSNFWKRFFFSLNKLLHSVDAFAFIMCLAYKIEILSFEMNGWSWISFLSILLRYHRCLFDYIKVNINHMVCWGWPLFTQLIFQRIWFRIQSALRTYKWLIIIQIDLVAPEAELGQNAFWTFFVVLSLGLDTKKIVVIM